MRFAVRVKQNRRPGETSPRTWSRIFAVALAASVGGMLWAGAVAADSIVTPDGVEYEDVYIRATEHLYYVQVPDSGEIITVRREEVDSDEVRVHPDPDHREQLLRDWHEARGLERVDPEARVEERIEEVTPEEPVVEPPEPTLEAPEEVVTPEVEPEEPAIEPPLEDIGAPQVEAEVDGTEPVGLPEEAPEIEAEAPMIDDPLDDFVDLQEAPRPEEDEEEVLADEEPIAEPRDSIEIYVPEGERRHSDQDRQQLMEIRESFRRTQRQQQVGGRQPDMDRRRQQPGAPQQQQFGGPGQRQPQQQQFGGPGQRQPQQQQLGGPGQTQPRQQQQPSGPGGPQAQPEPQTPGQQPDGPTGDDAAPAPSPDDDYE